MFVPPCAPLKSGKTRSMTLNVDDNDAIYKNLGVMTKPSGDNDITHLLSLIQKRTVTHLRVAVRFGIYGWWAMALGNCTACKTITNIDIYQVGGLLNVPD